MSLESVFERPQRLQLPCCRTTLPFGQYQIILLGDGQLASWNGWESNWFIEAIHITWTAYRYVMSAATLKTVSFASVLLRSPTEDMQKSTFSLYVQTNCHLYKHIVNLLKKLTICSNKLTICLSKLIICLNKLGYQFVWTNCNLFEQIVICIVKKYFFACPLHGSVF